MIGLRTGLAAGLRVGLAASLGSDPIVPDAAAGSNTTLSVALTDSADPVITAVAFSYSFIVTNTGSNSASSVTASVTLDASLAYGSASGTGWAVDASALPVVTFTRASLAVGAAPTITVNVTSGGSALTASSAGNGSASNAPAATTSTQTTAVKLVSKDATSGIRVPNSSTEWTDFIAYAGLSVSVPNSLWRCQEASGNLADSIGSLTLTAVNSPGYSGAAAGWTRVGVTTADAGTARFSAAAASGPNPTTTSSLWIWYVAVTSAAATRMISHGGGATAPADVSSQVLATLKLRNRCVAVTTDGTATMATTAQPIGILYDRTGARTVSYSLAEKVTGTYSASVTDGNKGIGASTGSTTPAATYIYGFMFSGAAAELPDATVKSLLTALGFAIPWS